MLELFSRFTIVSPSPQEMIVPFSIEMIWSETWVRSSWQARWAEMRKILSEDKSFKCPKGQKAARGDILAKEAQVRGDTSFGNYHKDTKTHDNTCQY